MKSKPTPGSKFRLSRTHPGARTRASLILVLALTAAPVLAESVRFTFDPPTPLTYIETVKTTRRDARDGGNTREMVGIARQEVELKRNGEGYLMTVRPLSLKQIVNGQAVDVRTNPIVDVIQKSVFTFELNADGKILSVQGVDQVKRAIDSLIETLKARMNDQQKAQMASLLKSVDAMTSEEAILARAREEWDGRVSGYAGTEMEVGEVLVWDQPFQLPTGQAVRYANVVKFLEMVDCDGGQCARILYRYDTDRESLRDYAGELFESIPEFEVGKISVSGQGDRVIDPRTLLIQSEVMERTIGVEVAAPGQGSQAGSRYEKREYTYEYPARED